MSHASEIENLIKKAIPDAQVRVEDMTGTNDHFHIFVVSAVFRGKMLIDQHRLVQESLQPAFEDGRIHAVQIKTQTPDEQTKKHSEENDLHIIE